MARGCAALAGAATLALCAAAGAQEAPDPGSVRLPKPDAERAEAPTFRAPEADVPADIKDLPARERAPVIVRGEVIRRPTAAETTGSYPDKAARDAKPGRATVVCEVALSTRLENCVITAEDPPGYGFGDALMQATAFYRVRPPSVDGEPVPGTKITIPMRFEFNLQTAVEQGERDAAEQRGKAPPPRETPAQRFKRLGPLKVAGELQVVPLGFAGLVLAGMAVAYFWPLQQRRKSRSRGQWA